MVNVHYNHPSGVESGTPTSWVPQSKPIWFTELGCPAIDRGTNQPNVFFDPNSSESFTPNFSRGWRDDTIQRAYLEATYLWWDEAANNPVSSVYGGRMVHVPECAAWTWDARPYPFFPALTDVCTDGANWQLGHWLTGRLGAVSLAALVRHLCLSGKRHARRSGSRPRGRCAGTDARLGDRAAAGAQMAGGPGRRGLRRRSCRSAKDPVDTTRIASESFHMAVPPEEAERRCRRALMEAWTGRETAAFRLLPSRLALDPADVVTLAHDGRQIPLPAPPGSPRLSSLSKAVVFGAPEVVPLDLPQLTEDQPAHRPFIAAHATLWPGEMAVFRSPSTDGFDLLTTFGGRARIGTLVSDFYAGPTSRFDLGSALLVDLLTGTLESVTDLTLFGGANVLAIETAPRTWEIVQAGAAELIAPGRHRLTRLLQAHESWCWTLRWRRCQSPRPISDCRGIGASDPRAVRSARRHMLRPVSRRLAWV